MLLNITMTPPTEYVNGAGGERGKFNDRLTKMLHHLINDAWSIKLAKTRHLFNEVFVSKQERKWSCICASSI